MYLPLNILKCTKRLIAHIAVNGQNRIIPSNIMNTERYLLSLLLKVI